MLVVAVGLLAAETANAPVRESVIDGAGIGGARRLPSLGHAARAGLPIGGLRCAAGLKLGHLFAIWGKPLTRGRVARWRGTVRAHVGGLRWRRDPAAIPLLRHAQIVVQAGEPVLRPHAHYRFPPGQ